MSRKRKVLLFVLLAAIFYSGLFLFGVKECGDTQSYREMRTYREPLYGLLLMGFENLFGQQTGDRLVGFLQNTLIVISIYVLLVYSIETLQIKKKIVIAGITVGVLAPFILTPVFSAEQTIISNALMTEGIIVPLYLFLVVLFSHLIWQADAPFSKQIAYRIGIWCIIFTMILMRGQMLETIVVWMCLETILFVSGLKKRSFVQKRILFFFFILISVLLLLVTKSTVVKHYNLKFNGISHQTTYSDITFLTNVIYVSDEDSVELVTDPNLHDLYDRIYTKCDELKLLQKYAPSDLGKEAEFYFHSHDTMKLEIMQVEFLSYIYENYPELTFAQAFVKMDEMSSDITKAILPGCGVKWISNYFKNVAIGLIRSVAVAKRYLYIPVLCGYIYLIVLGLILLKKEEKKRVHFFWLVTLMTAGTVSSISLMIMCLSRYMIYNMPLIYMAGILMTDQLISDMIKNDFHKEVSL